MDQIDRTLIATGTCPYCKAELLAGPKGGLSQNWYCTNRQSCRAGFVFARWRKQLFHFEELPNIPNGHFEMYNSKRRNR